MKKILFLLVLILCSSMVFAEDNTVLLMHMDGDDSSSQHTATAYGNPVLTDTAMFSQSGVFDGSDSYLTIPDSSDWDFGSGDFTIDFWIKTSASIDQKIIADWRNGDDPNQAFLIDTNSNQGDGKLRFFARSGSQGYTVNTDQNIADGKWHHVAAVRNSSRLMLFLDGVRIGDEANSNSEIGTASLNNPSYEIYVGKMGNYNGKYINGNIDEIRISKGIARWTSNFNPPTEPHTSDSYTKLLLHMDGSEGSTTFTDSGNTGHTVTAYDNAHISGLEDDFGDAMEFDGTDDYLSLPLDSSLYLESSDFTIDFWLNSNTFGDNNYGRGVTAYTDNNNKWRFYIYDNVAYFDEHRGGSLLASESWSLSSNLQSSLWYHIALVKSGTSFTLYINGESQGTNSVRSDLYGDFDNLYIGRVYGTYGWRYFDGYMDEFRFSKGVARWTTNFPSSLPSAPYEPDTNTKLLLHFDGDASNSNHPVTFAGSSSDGVDMSASTYKFDGSYYFDGNDYLSIPDSPDFDFETGDFTIDVWVNLDDNPNARRIITQSEYYYNGQKNFDLHYNAQNFYFYGYGTDGSTRIIELTTSSGNYLAGQWYHVAVVRDGSNAYLFVNGNLVATDTTASGEMKDSNLPIIVGAEIINTGYHDYFKGYIDELRITKEALWTTGFTPPSAPEEDPGSQCSLSTNSDFIVSDYEVCDGKIFDMGTGRIVINSGGFLDIKGNSDITISDLIINRVGDAAAIHPGSEIHIE